MGENTWLTSVHVLQAMPGWRGAAITQTTTKLLLRRARDSEGRVLGHKKQIHKGECVGGGGNWVFNTRHSDNMKHPGGGSLNVAVHGQLCRHVS